MDEALAELVRYAYWAGYRRALVDVDEGGRWWASWAAPPGRDWVAERLADMERRAGPPRYRGGPVDWETGAPAAAARAAA